MRKLGYFPTISLYMVGWKPLGHYVAVVQLLSCIQLFVTPWTAACQTSLSFTISWSLLKLMSIESVMLSNHLILFALFFSCLQSLPASGSSPMNWLIESGGQSIKNSASASVLPMNIQDWFLLGLTGLISLLSQGLSRVFSSTTGQKHQFFGAQLSLWANSHIHMWLLEKPSVSSVAQSCPTLWDPVNRCTPGLPVQTQTRVYPNPCPSSQWCHPTISSSVVPFSSCPQSFPASGSFQMSQLFASGGQSIGVSASTSVLPMDAKDWSPLGWTGWISLASKRLSRVFSNTTVQKHQFFGAQLSL